MPGFRDFADAGGFLPTGAALCPLASMSPMVPAPRIGGCGGGFEAGAVVLALLSGETYGSLGLVKN